MRFRLRTLMIVLALGPMVLAVGYFAWRDEPDLFFAGMLVLTTLALFMWGHLFLIHPGSSTDPSE